MSQSLLGKRGFDTVSVLLQLHGGSERFGWSAGSFISAFIGPQAAGVPYPANGRPYTSGMRTTSQSVIKRQKVSQGEAPNPVVFVATKDTRYRSGPGLRGGQMLHVPAS